MMSYSSQLVESEESVGRVSKIAPAYLGEPGVLIDNTRGLGELKVTIIMFVGVCVSIDK